MRLSNGHHPTLDPTQKAQHQHQHPYADWGPNLLDLFNDQQIGTTGFHGRSISVKKSVTQLGLHHNYEL